MIRLQHCIEMMSMNRSTHIVKVSVSLEGAGGISDITGRNCGQSALCPAAQWLLLCHQAEYISQRFYMKSIHVSLCSSDNCTLHVYRSCEFLQRNLFNCQSCEGGQRTTGRQPFVPFFGEHMKEIISTVQKF